MTGPVSAILPKLRNSLNAIVFVTGTTGSGKSTLVENLMKYGVHGVFPGREIRNKPEIVKKIERSKNPAAPDFCWNFVKNLVESGASKKGHVAIDGMPRSEEQFKWCIELSQKLKKMPIFVILRANKEVRIKRLAGRDKQVNLMNKRLDYDDLMMEKVESVIAKGLDNGMGYESITITTGGVK